jgi:NTP pyrophosphatase (non-canonical NTP hydrolase)
MDDVMKDVLRLVEDEMKRQDEKWGVGREQHDMVWLTILTEEVGETAETILKKEPTHTQEELVQVTAVCMQWLKEILRRNPGDGHRPWCARRHQADICDCGANHEHAGGA